MVSNARRTAPEKRTKANCALLTMTACYALLLRVVEMNNITTLRGMIKGMEMMGAEYVKTDGFDLFFNIPINSELDDNDKLKRVKEAFTKMFGLGLRVRRINCA
jgi:hypothetical protein